MSRYSVEYKEMIDDAVGMSDLMKESGVSRSTLYKWRQQYGLGSSKRSKMSGELKFSTLKGAKIRY